MLGAELNKPGPAAQATTETVRCVQGLGDAAQSRPAAQANTKRINKSSLILISLISGSGWVGDEFYRAGSLRAKMARFATTTVASTSMTTTAS